MTAVLIGILGAIVDNLIGRTQEPLVATVRNLDQGTPLAGISYRAGNFDDPAALASSLAGVGTVLVNATFFGVDRDRREGRVAAAIRAATDAGA